VEWVKAKSEAGDNFDSIEIVRAFPKDSKRKQIPIKVKISFFVEHNPKKYRLSPQLQRVLGIEEDSRLRIIGALWQYIKSNRLQDSDNREVVNCNAELLEVFGEDKLEFHTLVFKLKEHLHDVLPLELGFEILTKRGAPQSTVHFYDLPAFQYRTQSQKEQLDFLINCNYDFFAANPDAPDKSRHRLALNGSLLKKRELKCNLKIQGAIEKMKKNFVHADFFSRMAQDPKAQIQNVIIDQNKWLRVMQEEPYYDTTAEHDQAAFFQGNQAWVLGEVENYIER